MKLKELNIKGYKRFYLNEISTLDYTPTSSFQLIIGRNGSGKAQPLSSKILLSDGNCTTFADIKIDDLVLTPKGTSERVLAVFDQGERENLCIVTSSGRKANCCGLHLWYARMVTKRGKSKTALLETRSISLKMVAGYIVFIPVYEDGKMTWERVKRIYTEGSTHMKCIMISGEDNLYITNDNLVTHNTSMLNAIFNQPADKQDYDKSGYNKVLFEHKGHEYLLSSSFDGQAKYSFKRRSMDRIEDDFEELNQSRLVSTQKELVKEHFRLDGDIIDLLLGQTEFTQMSVSKRREWFNKMHVADLSYITNLFQTLKSKERDAKGTINTVSNKAIIEKNTQISKEEFENLLTRREELNRENHNLAKAFNQEIIDKYNPDKLKALIQSLSVTSNQLIPYFDNNLINYEDLKTDVNESYNYFTSLKTRKEELNKQIIIAKKRFDKIALDKKEYSQYSSTEMLQLNEKNCIVELDKIKATLAQYSEHDTFKYDSPYLSEDNIEDITRSLIMALPEEDDNPTLNGINMDELIERRKQMNNRVDNINFNLDKLIDRKKHITQHLSANEVTCPNCHRRFNLNKELEDMEVITRSINKLANELNAAKKDQTDIESTYENYMIYRSRFDRLKPLIEKYSLNELIPAILHNKSYASRRDLLFTYGKVYSLKNKVRGLNSELKLVQEQLKLRAERGEDYFQKIESRLDEVEQELLSYQDNINKIDEEITLLEKSISVKKNIIEIGLKKLPSLLKEIDKEIIARVKYEQNCLLKQKWENTLTELQVINKKYNEYNLKENLIKGYEEIIEENKKKVKEYGILLKELSPQGGLIAERATAFINLFIENLNKVIRKIFNYDLIVEPCDLEEGDLTYRFKVTGGNQIRNDVSNTSEGQKEVINLAFKLLAYHYCHLEEIPFINDELGKNFDEHHKQAGVNYLKELMIEDRFIQFFLISHHATSYTSLIDTEVVVLDKNNVVLPEKYNTGLLINGKKLK
jgi:hypothetical protein